MTSFYNAFLADPGGFTLRLVVGGATPTSFTATHSEGWEINYRMSAGTILSLINPSGGISNSAAPGTPTNAYAEDVLLPVVSATATRWQFAQYGDAVFFAINGSAGTFSAYAFHQGKIRISNNEASTAQGLGTLAYLPADAAAGTPGAWYNTSATAGSRKSYIRYALSAWGQPAIPVGFVGFAVQVGARLGDMALTVADAGVQPSTSSSPIRGVLRYLRADTTTTAPVPLSVLPSDTTNQGWLRLNSSAAATRQVILWDKLVTP
jgi:hypothetical protein